MTTTSIIRNGRGRPRGPEKLMVPVKMTREERTRFKIACAQEGNLSYAGLILMFLDERDARLRRAQAKQAHPFHRPPLLDDGDEAVAL